ncbi:PTS sugar transporter subunit IIC [Oceanobacillus oncorhynchi]|uniref:PTS mannose/fructose/sorbose/N-acetylgalactosamine transporter subunit IIC n=1 Tax=Oceanobacillus TaxID=182709 RepID=UPI001D01FACF|nr:PTS sugar transporter subunit IIC [Oceanobacillus oncorhynchi]UUI38913.1 PTS sugar transporter subunit IIC [Oceanobacillus oncorhynchi]
MDMLAIAIFTGLWYWICKTDIGYGITHAIRQPLFSAIPIGLIMGDLKTALIIGAGVQILYIGLVAAGSNLPADDSLAGLIAIPIAISANLSTELAIAIAVPVGVMGVFIDQLRKTVNVVFVHMADKFAAEGNAKQVVLSAILYPTILSFFMRFPVPFFANLYGANAVENFMNSVPEWLLHGFSVAGGLLPALGFALTMFVIGKKQLLPWFFIGYFLVQFSGLPIMGVAIFGICIIILLNVYQNNKMGVQ